MTSRVGDIRGVLRVVVLRAVVLRVVTVLWSVVELCWAVLPMLFGDLLLAKVAASCLGFGEPFCGVTSSCIFLSSLVILPFC